QHAEALPLFQMIGKNVGIRRARAPFVLCTNIDILFSDELMRFIASGGLRSGRMYRLDRYDVQNDVPVDGPIDTQLKYCRENTLRIHARDGAFLLTPEGHRSLTARDIATPQSGITFGAGWYGVERWCDQVIRWASNGAELVAKAPDGPIRALC